MNTKSERKTRIIISIILLTGCIVFVLIPFITLISISISDEMRIIKEGYSIIPKGFSLKAYKFFIDKDFENILNSYGISAFITIVGGSVGLIICAMIAYPLSRKDFTLRKAITIYIAIIMFFNGGLVPTYILMVKYLHLKNTLFALIIPLVVVPWYIIILRTFFSNIPFALIESAKLDGAGEMRIFIQIITPLSKPALATVGLFLVLAYWNSWFPALLYLDEKSLYPLQYVLHSVMRDVEEMFNNANVALVDMDLSKLPTESMRMAICIIVAGPMLFVFPFFQKYFVRGLTVGSVKG